MAPSGPGPRGQASAGVGRGRARTVAGPTQPRPPHVPASPDRTGGIAVRRAAGRPRTHPSALGPSAGQFPNQSFRRLAVAVATCKRSASQLVAMGSSLKYKDTKRRTCLGKLSPLCTNLLIIFVPEMTYYVPGGTSNPYSITQSTLLTVTGSIIIIALNLK